MARGRKPRVWVKMDCEGILHGSINYLLSLEGQAIWMKMIALSEICGGRPGYIEDNNEKGLPHEYIAHELHCPVEVLDLVLKIMEGDKAIETIDGTGSIHLVNFHHYQFSEYDRQKPYREAKKLGNKAHKFCPSCGYKGLTNEEYCPKCENIPLERDYTSGKYGHMVRK